uniref:Uncharacterized protein n=1 Tax=Cyprinus carpio TaxID=7962 RepID=A0A8C2K275_CYPCA
MILSKRIGALAAGNLELSLSLAEKALFGISGMSPFGPWPIGPTSPLMPCGPGKPSSPF